MRMLLSRARHRFCGGFRRKRHLDICVLTVPQGQVAVVLVPLALVVPIIVS